MFLEIFFLNFQKEFSFLISKEKILNPSSCSSVKLEVIFLPSLAKDLAVLYFFALYTDDEFCLFEGALAVDYEANLPQRDFQELKLQY
jgi:hypothetical protein